MLQELINIFYRYPKSNWEKIQQFGGILKYRAMLAGQKAMKEASRHLPPIVSAENGLAIYFLTGKNFLYQTYFCAYSLSIHTKEALQFILVDDGSFNESIIQSINHQMPGVKIINQEHIKKNLARALPEKEFPFLHHKRKVYPHIKKLTDIHTIDPGFKLVLDSDMLFWKEPKEILNWLRKPKGVTYMLDYQESYGYSKDLMQKLCKHPIPSFVNVGVIGMHSEQIDWKKIENWVKELEGKEGISYYLEQALTAMLIADKNCSILERSEYIVHPSSQETIENLGTLHHYVNLSKNDYFKISWKKFITLPHSNYQPE